MLKRRIIPVQLLVGGRLVKPVRFGAWRDVGDPVKSSKVYNDQSADELVFLDIDRDARSASRLRSILSAVSAVCFMPLSVGGGIRSFDDAAAIIRDGADKVVVNSALYSDRALADRVAAGFGRQALVAAVDVRKLDGEYVCFSDCGRQREGIPLDEHVERVVSEGAGELMIQSIDRDGTMEGYDHELLQRVAELVDVPVIGAGGSGTFAHLVDGFQKTSVSALACGSIFNFGDNNPVRARATLLNAGVPMKLV